MTAENATSKNATTIEEQTALVDLWLASAHDDTVIHVGEYSPNGSPSAWGYHTPAEQTGPELTDEHGEPLWDVVTLSADRQELTLQSTPERSKHTYQSYTHTEPDPQEILIAFHGEGDACDWDDIQNFADFLTANMGLDSRGDAFNACMKAALEEAADQL